MNKPELNLHTMDIFTKSGREKFDQYEKRKKEWLKQNSDKAQAKQQPQSLL